MCEDESNAKQLLGIEITKSLQKRLSDLLAARTLSLLPQVFFTSVAEAMYCVHLYGDHKLFFEINHANIPYKGDKEIDIEKVTRIKILKIENESL